LDHISQGRVEFGVGRGTFPDTHDGFNSPFAESRERFDEYLEIIVKAWTQERFSFTGKHYRCDNLWVRPKPLQRPHPPIRVGITGDWSAQAQHVRSMSYDDWLRDKVVYGTPEKVVDRLQQLRDELDLTQILYEVNHGRQLPYALQLENLKLINERVIPQLK